MEKPVLIYDGDCHFCRRWIERWRVMTGDRVEYLSSLEAAERFPEIPADEFSSAVQWVGVDGTRSTGAKAVFLALATSGWTGRVLLGLYRWPVFAGLAEGVYRFIAGRRRLFSGITRLLWGGDVRPPTFAVSSRIFIRVLGFIYLIAFISYWAQMEGLSGSRGILPAQEFFAALGSAGVPVRNAPSFLWWGASDAALHGWCAAGTLAALLVTFGVAPGPCLVFLWADYLSLVVAGREFYQFQWDILLLEAGFLAIFLAPWRLKPVPAASPPRAAHFLLVWLLFRLMFESGVVKLTSGDASWAGGDALDFHYFTQPLPTVFAWYMQQMPGWFHWLSVKAMFAVELVLPFFLFGPRRLRLLAAAGIAALQVVIAATGNYGFFNLLTLALCLLAVDDATWGRRVQGLRSKVQSRRSGVRGSEIENRKSRIENSPGFLPRWVVWPVAAAVFVLSLVPLAATFRRPMPWMVPLAGVFDSVRPFRTINGYGLFAVMTRERREIIVQGSDDGLLWKTYIFRYKPGDVARPPRWVAPYMPRLDWQMWFAALGSAEQNPWFLQFLQCLAEGSPPVLDLLARNPFPGNPPRHLRALSDGYVFTTWKERAETGNWWKSEPAAIYWEAAQAW